MNHDPNERLRALVAQQGGITREQYEEIARMFPPPHATPDTTPTQAAWLLGTQAVLLALVRYIRS